MKKKSDFVFIYEVKNRELESIILLKCELERRGYSVELIETWENEQNIIEPAQADIVVSFALYNDETLNFLNKFVKKCNLFVNLQWEQIYTNGDNNTDKIESLSTEMHGSVKDCIHICWGEKTFNRLTEQYGLPKENARITGNVSLDFLRPEFREYYYSRQEIVNKYNINRSGKVYLFISSFSYVSLPESILESDLYQKQALNTEKQYEISTQSRKILLEWFRRELELHPDITIIYRPHPAETASNDLKEMEKKFANFKSIGELSINQWIAISDKLYTWWSTSVAAIYAAGKGCDILRPIQIPQENELEIYKSIKSVSSYEEFDKEFLKPNEFPIAKNVMEKYYYIDPLEPAYVKICNVLEKVLKTRQPWIDTSLLHTMNKSQRIAYTTKKRFKSIVLGKTSIYNVARTMIGNRKLFHGFTIEQKKKEYEYFLDMKKKNTSSPEEILAIENSIRKIVRQRWLKTD